MVERETSFMKPKHQCHLSQWVELAYVAQTWKERRLLCESEFVLIDTRTLILKNGWKKSFLWNQSINIIYSNGENYFMVHNYEKKKRLLHQSMFIPIDKWTLILKMVGSEVFLMRPKGQFIYPNEENVFMVPNHEKKGDYYVNPCLSQLTYELWF